MVWDQTQDEYFTFYRFGGSGVYTFPQCPGTINGRHHAGTMSDPCPIGINPSDSMVNPRNDPKGYGVNFGKSLGEQRHGCAPGPDYDFRS